MRTPGPSDTVPTVFVSVLTVDGTLKCRTDIFEVKHFGPASR